MKTNQARSSNYWGFVLTAFLFAFISYSFFTIIANAAVGGPGVMVSSTIATTTNNTSIPVTVQFSEDVSGFNAADLTLSNASTSGFSGSGANYSFMLMPLTQGTSTVSVNADMSSSTNASSTGNQASNLLTFFYVPVMATATPATTSISSVMVTPTGTHSAMISWNSTASSTATVSYGTSAAYGTNMMSIMSTSTAFSVTLVGLTEATLYHFVINSTLGSSTASSGDIVFTSGSSASTTPLALTGITAVRTNATADGTFANGLSWVLHFIVPSIETFFKLRFNDFVNPTASSTVAAAQNIRIFSPQSTNATSESNAIISTSTSYGSSLLFTSGDASPSTPGRQVDLTVQVAVPVGTPVGTYSTQFSAFSTTTQ